MKSSHSAVEETTGYPQARIKTNFIRWPGASLTYHANKYATYWEARASPFPAHNKMQQCCVNARKFVDSFYKLSWLLTMSYYTTYGQPTGISEPCVLDIRIISNIHGQNKSFATKVSECYLLNHYLL